MVSPHLTISAAKTTTSFDGASQKKSIERWSLDQYLDQHKVTSIGYVEGIEISDTQRKRVQIDYLFDELFRAINEYKELLRQEQLNNVTSVRFMGDSEYPVLGYPTAITDDALIEYSTEEDALDVAGKIKEFEIKFGMNSAEFLKRWEEDSVPDTFETNYWAALLRYNLSE